MGQVILVRHGQASFGAADYDVLSPLGERQAAVLGEALTGLSPDAVLHGSMQRQRRTAELVAEAAGWTTPLEVDPRWDEMDHLAMLAAEPAPMEGEPDRKQFQGWFEAATRRWTAGDHDHEYAESFPEFRDRVEAALSDVVARAGTVVVVTSGGPIASVTTSLLDGGVHSYLRLAPVVVNSSRTLVVTGTRGATLVSFNEHDHLRGHDELLTYR